MFAPIKTDLQLLKLTHPDGSQIVIEFSGEVWFKDLEPVFPEYEGHGFNQTPPPIVENELTLRIRRNPDTGVAYTIFPVGDADE
mgnify:CR=1 FL=1